MIQQSWQSYLQHEGARRSSAAAAGAPSERSNAGIAWLSELTVAAFQGPDVLRFLQGYLTCDTASLDGARLVPAAICSLKGRVVVNGWCFAPAPDQVLFVIHESLFDALAAMLQVYLRFSKTRLTDRRDTLLVFGGLGLDPEPAGTPLDPTRQLFLCDSVQLAAELWHRHPQLADGAWQAALIADGVPLVSAPTSDAFLPQMLNLPELGAINFNKGCYLGQEVVARAQHRGQVKRHLVRLAWQGSEPPLPGAELADAGGRARATVVQSTGSAGTGTALAVVQDDTDFPLTLGTTTFRPAD